MLPSKLSGHPGAISTARLLQQNSETRISSSQNHTGLQLRSAENQQTSEVQAARVFKQLIQSTPFSHCNTVEEIAQVQFERNITCRSSLPPRPHRLNLPFGTVQQAQESMQRFEQATSNYVDAATSLNEALRPAWAQARKRHPNRAGTDLERQDVHSSSIAKKNQSASWANSLPFGTNVSSAYKTNCYGYACNKAKSQQAKNLSHELHPGEVAGLEYWDRDAPVEPGREQYADLELPARSATVNNILKKALADGLSLEPLPGGYPVYFAVAPDDYHWYRQDDTGYWSHKPGSNAARNKDGDGGVSDRLITNPMLANRRHGYTHYDRGGCFLWVPTDFASNSLLPLYAPMNPHST